MRLIFYSSVAARIAKVFAVSLTQLQSDATQSRMLTFVGLKAEVKT